ncbi:MAG: helix-turn-helix domain-containing protein, partial [Candidatus Hydrogenedens sp.]
SIFNLVACGVKRKNQKERFALLWSVLEKKLMSDCSLFSIAEEMQIEFSALSHWIKRNIGINYEELLNYIQIEKIAEFLRDTDKNISEIGDCMGIKYGSLVSNKFKKTTGWNPIEYKTFFRRKKRGHKREL